MNWRAKDVAWYFGFLLVASACAEFHLTFAVIVNGGLALLQLVEMTLHAFADAMKDAK